MAVNDVLESVAEAVRQINVSIKDSQTLIDALREAGETTAELDAKQRSLIARKQKWESMLKGRGYDV